MTTLLVTCPTVIKILRTRISAENAEISLPRPFRRFLGRRVLRRLRHHSEHSSVLSPEPDCGHRGERRHHRGHHSPLAAPTDRPAA